MLQTIDLNVHYLTSSFINKNAFEIKTFDMYMCIKKIKIIRYCDDNNTVYKFFILQNQ